METDTQKRTLTCKWTDYNNPFICKRFENPLICKIRFDNPLIWKIFDKLFIIFYISLSTVPEALYEVVYRDLVMGCTNDKMFTS